MLNFPCTAFSGYPSAPSERSQKTGTVARVKYPVSESLFRLLARKVCLFVKNLMSATDT